MRVHGIVRLVQPPTLKPNGFEGMGVGPKLPSRVFRQLLLSVESGGRTAADRAEARV